MSAFAFIRVIFLVILVLEIFSLDQKDNCNKLRLDAHFEIGQLVGKVWRVYYSWDIDQDVNDNCHDLHFRNATPRIINRIWNDMYEYLETQPQWVAAVLLMSTNPRHEMLLFTDIIPGRFIGVANVVRAEGVLPRKKNSVPLFKIHMKLLERGRYLVVSDCNIGITTMSVRLDKMPFRGEMEIRGAAASLGLGDGNMICPIEKNIDQIFEDS